MKQVPRLTLITSGPTRHNLFARFPKLAQLLGPIRATSPRTATRAASLFRGGWAAGSWSEVLDSPLIVIQTPGPKLFAEMQELGKPAWRGRIVLACDSESELRHLAGLESLGASIAHMHSLDKREPLVALSGDNSGIVRARRLLTASGIRCLTIRDGAGPGLLSAIGSLEKRIATALREGDRAFLHAGLRRAEARVVGVGAALRALRR
jgi:hypothetical protein